MAGGTPGRGVARSLRLRLVLLTLAGTLVPIAILGWLSLSSVRSLQQRVLAERQHLAVSVATHIDSLLSSQFELLETISPKAVTDSQGGIEVPPSALRENYARSRLFSRVFVLDGTGTVLQSEPPVGSPPLHSTVKIPGAEAALT